MRVRMFGVAKISCECRRIEANVTGDLLLASPNAVEQAADLVPHPKRYPLWNQANPMPNHATTCASQFSARSLAVCEFKVCLIRVFPAFLPVHHVDPGGSGPDRSR